MKSIHAFASAVGLFLATATAFPISHLTSTNIAVIPNYTGGGYGGGSAGTVNPAWFPGYTFTTLIPPQVTDWTSLAQYDTVILYQFCNINSYPSFTSNLVAWVKNTGGKVLIWDSDSCANSTYYGWLAPLGASFDRSSPGQTGNFGGSLTVVDDNNFGSTNTSSPYYINTAVMVAQTDAVGDLNVVNENTVSPVWCAQMRGVNTYGDSGYAHMYSRVGGLLGAADAMIVYCGLDTDYISAPGPSGGGQMQKLFALELAHGWGPSGVPEVADLLCQQPIGNLVGTPVNATTDLTNSHTVTATASLSLNYQTIPQANVPVTFMVISGPNTGVNAIWATDVNGHATFNYSSTTLGMDIIQLSGIVGGTNCVAYVTNTWTTWVSGCNPPVTTSTPKANRGYYLLNASSACYTNLQIFVRDTASTNVAGPYTPGTTVRIKKSTTPGTGAGVAPASVTVFVKGDGEAVTKDPTGTPSLPVTLKPL